MGLDFQSLIPGFEKKKPELCLIYRWFYRYFIFLLIFLRKDPSDANGINVRQNILSDLYDIMLISALR